MIGQVLQLIGILGIVFGLVVSILGALWRMDTIIRLEGHTESLEEKVRQLNKDIAFIDSRLIKMEGKQS